MTTIAANKTTMAADSKTDCDGTWFGTTKLYRIGDSIVGAAGDNSAIVKFITWFRNKRTKRPTFSDNESFSALILTPRGLFHMDDSMGMDLVKDDYFAVGSGAVAALVAMDCGLSPTEAVEAACKRDQLTGGPVDTMTL